MGLSSKDAAKVKRPFAAFAKNKNGHGDEVDPLEECIDRYGYDEAVKMMGNVVVFVPRPRKDKNCLQTAVYLAERFKWKIFPARIDEDGKKYSWLSAEFAPEGLNWGMTSDIEQLKKNFNDSRCRGKAGVGVPTGKVNNIFVVEADTKKGHDVDGVGNLEKLEAKHGKLPDTLMAESPTKSPHRYFNYPPGMKIKGSTSEIAEGVDVKSDGGMVVAPPSVRPGVGVYRWLNDLPIADAPQWLLDLVCEKEQEPQSENGEEKSVYKTFNEKAGYEKPPLKKIEMALSVLPIPDRKFWVDIGHAIKSEYADNNGLLLFLDWSQKWEGDQDKTLKQRIAYTINTWESFKPNRNKSKNITIGSLFFHANEADPSWHDRWQEELQQPSIADNGLKDKLLQTSAEFVEAYVPPDYLVDGLLQRRYVYSLTAPTGSGKTCIALRIAIHVALGLPLGGREVVKGKVLMFAGENPDDVRSRWIKLCEEMGYDPKDVDLIFMPFVKKLSADEVREQINAEAAKHGPFSLLIVDTSASYYSGDEENDNVQLGDHARMLRTFVELPGGPTILVTCHPTKTPNMDNLLPRGGGAFLAEVDGNLVCLKESGSMVVEITWHGKFRGPDFPSFAFKLVPGQSDKLIDTKGRRVWTITARPISDAEQEQIEEAGNRNEDDLLRTMLDYPGLSLVDLAKKLNWTTDTGLPNKSYVFRMLKDLTKQKLVEKQRKRYVLTAKGEKAAEELPKVKYIEVVPINKDAKTH